MEASGMWHGRSGYVIINNRVQIFCRIVNSAIVLKGENTSEETWLKSEKMYVEV